MLLCVKTALQRTCSMAGALRAAWNTVRLRIASERTPFPLACWRRLGASAHPAIAKVSMARLREEIGRFTSPSGNGTCAVIVRMPSWHFLRMTTPNNRFVNMIRREAAHFDPALFERFGSQEDSLPYLELALSGQGDKLKTVIMQHEGRHRAASVMDAGGYDIPVVLYYGKKSPVSGASMDGIKLHGQFGRGVFVIKEAASMMRGEEEEAFRVANGLPKKRD